MSFCVEDGYNTSYIDSVLIALFYKPTHLHELLTQLPEKTMFSYLQELIFSNFVEQVRKNYSVNSGMKYEIILLYVDGKMDILYQIYTM
jgi:hypothetical protein